MNHFLTYMALLSGARNRRREITNEQAEMINVAAEKYNQAVEKKQVAKKAGRNTQCPCNSGLKSKRCCQMIDINKLYNEYWDVRLGRQV